MDDFVSIFGVDKVLDGASARFVEVDRIDLDHIRKWHLQSVKKGYFDVGVECLQVCTSLRSNVTVDRQAMDVEQCIILENNVHVIAS